MKKLRRSLLGRFLSFPVAAGGFSLAGSQAAYAQDNAVGSLERAEGRVSRVNASGSAQELRQGHSVYEGDRILTAAGSEAVLKLMDGAVIAVRPSTEFSLAQYRFKQGSPQESGALIQLVRGGLRKLTGLIGKANPSSVRITTATATIGIRGTEFEITQIEAPATAVASNPSATNSGAAPADSTDQNTQNTPQNTSVKPSTNPDEPQPGAYIRVYSGLTTLKSNEDGKQTDVAAGQSAFAPNLAYALAIGGAVVQTFGLLRKSPAKAFFNGKFDGSMQSLSDTMTNELQKKLNQKLPSELRNAIPGLGNLFKR